MKDMTTEKANGNELILVIGATGNQGGYVAKKLLANGHKVRILVRNHNAPAAQTLANAGAEIVQGELGNELAISKALLGVTGVFSVSIPDFSGGGLESSYTEELVQLALKAGVRQFVHTSVVGCDKFPRWNGHADLIRAWNEKWKAEESVRNAGFEFWTILRPAWFMENCEESHAVYMLPQLKTGKITTAINADTRVDMIAGEDIGAFGCYVFENPTTTNGKHIGLAGDSRTMGEVAKTISEVTGKNVESVSLTSDEAVAAGLFQGSVSSHQWMNEIGFQIDIKGLEAYGIPLTTFEDWAIRNRTKIAID